MPSHPLSIQERRAASLSILVSPVMHSPTPSPLSISETRSAVSAVSSSNRFLWAPPLPAKDPLPSPMLKAKREQRAAQPSRWTWPFTTRPWTTICTAVTILLMLAHNQIYPWMMRSSGLGAMSTPVVELPSVPGPVSFTDSRGNQRWTIYIPESESFPLSATRYRAMYDASRRMRSQISGPQSKIAMPSRFRNSFDRDLVDKSFMDIAEAERTGALPKQPLASNDSSQICSSTMTFVLGSADVGFGKTLLALWLAYGAAQRQGRSFFIDDSLWPYGRYTDFFQDAPLPSCQKPPTSHMIPYPRAARHLVVTPASWSWILRDGGRCKFSKHKSNEERQHALFELARRGYQDLFHLTDENERAVSQRMSEIRAQAIDAGNTPVVGIHIRRGDLHPLEWIYSRDYLPYDRYAEAALDFLRARITDGASAGGDAVPVLLASDDPDTIVNQDFLAPLIELDFDVQLAQTQIVLASQRSLGRQEPIWDNGFLKHVDEAFGWEGGFFASLFNGLGKAPSGESTIDDGTTVPDKSITNLKRMIGRSYILDLAVLGQSDAVVCAISSSTCRALGVMMGWDKIQQGSWINVDEGDRWTFD